MEQYAGIHVSLELQSVCVVDVQESFVMEAKNTLRRNSCVA